MPFSTSQETIDILPAKENSDELATPRWSKRRKGHRLRFILIQTTTFTLILFAILYLALRIGQNVSASRAEVFEQCRLHGFYYSQSPHLRQHETSNKDKAKSSDVDPVLSLDCGDELSIESKVAHGCVFDLMHPGRVPRACSIDDLREEFLSLPEFTWFTDEANTKPLPQSAIWRIWELGGMVYGDLNYHTKHCEFFMRSLSRSLENTTVAFPAKFMDSAHTSHCIKVLEGKTQFFRNEVHFPKKIQCVWKS